MTVRSVCSCTSYRSASQRSNQASAPMRRGNLSSGAPAKRTLKAKLSWAKSWRGNQRLETSGERVNHLRPCGPWQTENAADRADGLAIRVGDDEILSLVRIDDQAMLA
jgi:hypothetical protein